MNSYSSHSADVRVALVGFGSAGSIFHANLIASVPHLHLHTIVSSKPQTVAAQWPTVQVVPTPQDAFANPDIDLVVVATGNDSHYPLAQAAMLAGKHVVVDKPCTVTLQETQSLLALAREQQRILTVFQNRRWDADFLGLQQVLAQGTLGRITHFESHFDRYRPTVPDRWREKDLPGSGLWFDLGAHLADQALALFGLPHDLLLDLGIQRDGAQVNDYFHAILRYPHLHDLRVVLHGSTLVAQPGPRFAVHGTHGSFVKYGLDTQENALKTGARPRWGDAAWGHDPVAAQLSVQSVQGLLVHDMPMPHGNYPAYYAAVRDAVQGRGAAPVGPLEVERTMQILTLGEESFRRGAFVRVAPPSAE